MDSSISERPTPAALPSTVTDAVKIVIVGGLGVGKTTMVRSVSEIRPLSTEETMTQAGVGVDHTSGVVDKNTTTVAFDFGRISLSEQLVLYLFGRPARSGSGSCGTSCSPARSARWSSSTCAGCPTRGTPSTVSSTAVPRFIVAHNNFDEPRFDMVQARSALSLSDSVPLVDCDARERASSKAVLIALVNHLYALSSARETTP